MTPPRRLWVFAVDHDAVQITWQAMGPGPVTFRAADVSSTVDTDGGPGSLVLRGLPPGQRSTIRIDGPGAGVPRQGLRRYAATLPQPAGRELFRFATISDLHIGERSFGYFGTMTEDDRPEEPHPVRATRAALRELHDWGAQLVIVKGDCTNDGRLDEWEEFGKLLADAGLPWHALPGNHDNRPVERRRTRRQHLVWLAQGGILSRFHRREQPTGKPVTPLEGFRSIGYEPPQPVTTVDVEGLRIVLADTSKTRQHLGGVRHAAPHILDAAADARRRGLPVFVAAHHYPMPLTLPHFWPPGVPAGEAGPFFAHLATAATLPGGTRPSAFYTAGHTHRNRRYDRSGVVCTEVGSPKDFPGTWAGYIVFESGISQVVRRVATPDILGWTDYSGQAALGLWQLWSPGLRSHRCFHHPWDRGRPGD